MKEIEVDTRPVLFVYLDIDGTLLILNESEKLKFCGASEEQDPRPWLNMMKEMQSRYGKKINLQFRILTARNSAEILVFALANLLNLKAINKETGEECESKDSKLLAALHLPEQYDPEVNIYISPDSTHSFQTPCFHWQNGPTPILFYWMDSLHYRSFTPTQPQSITEAITTQNLTGLLDWEKNSDLCQDIVNCAERSMLMSLSADRKITASALQDSKLSPPTHLTPILPKAAIMQLNLLEPWLKGRKVLGSILLDDQPRLHTPHLLQDQFLISCQNFRLYEFGSLELFNEVRAVFDELNNKIDELLSYHEEIESESEIKPVYSAAPSCSGLIPTIDLRAKAVWQEVTGGSCKGNKEFTFDFSLISIFLKNILEVTMEFKPINQLQTKMKSDLLNFIEKSYLALEKDSETLYLFPLKNSLSNQVKKIISQREYKLTGLFRKEIPSTLILDLGEVLKENNLQKPFSL